MKRNIYAEYFFTGIVLAFFLIIAYSSDESKSNNSGERKFGVDEPKETTSPANDINNYDSKQINNVNANSNGNISTEISQQEIEKNNINYRLSEIDDARKSTGDFEDNAKMKIQREEGGNEKAVSGILSVERLTLSMYQGQESKLDQLYNEFGSKFSSEQKSKFSSIQSDISFAKNLLTEKIQLDESTLDFMIKTND